jgi:hypothetical protein
MKLVEIHDTEKLGNFCFCDSAIIFVQSTFDDVLMPQKEPGL